MSTQAYQNYVADAGRRWVAVWSYADWKKAEEPVTSEDLIKNVFVQAGWPIRTEKSIIGEDGFNLKVKVESKNAPKVGGKLRLSAMFKAGKINAGDRLTVVKHSNSDATVIDGDQVMFETEGGKRIPMSWNEYAQRATGWKAVNIYKWIMVGDVLLDSLR